MSQLSRRALLLQSSAVAAAAAIGGLRPARAAAIEMVDVLQAALALEDGTIRSYRRIREERLLAGDELELCLQFLSNHERHAGRLRFWLRSLGSKPPDSPGKVAADLGAANALRTALRLETELQGAYLTHAGNINRGEILADAVSILIDETRHHTLLTLRAPAAASAQNAQSAQYHSGIREVKSES